MKIQKLSASGKRWFVSLAFLGVLFPLTADAKLSYSSYAGGNGGTKAFSLFCKEGRALIGIKGRSGWYVDRLEGVCTRFDEILASSSVQTTGATGGTGGTSSYEFRCPSGHVVTGLLGKSAGWIDKVGIKCGRLTSEGLIESGSVTNDFFAAGGTGGSSFNITCPSNKPALGLQGKSGWYVDKVRLACDKPALTPITAQSGRDLRVVVKDLPFRVPEDTSVQYHVELWNVGASTVASGATVDLKSDYPMLPLITVPFLGIGACDVHSYFGSNVFTRCTANRSITSKSLGMRVTVNFTAAQSGSSTYEFSGIADPTGQVSENNETNNIGKATMRVVD
ncbi:MAG: hypothetical protein AB7P69_08380 [Candidatus Binatia bacterium]